MTRADLRNAIRDRYELSSHEEARLLLIMAQMCDGGVPLECWPDACVARGGPPKARVEAMLKDIRAEWELRHG